MGRAAKRRDDGFDFAGAEMIPNLPSHFRPEDSPPFPEELVGATILRIGTLPSTAGLLGCWMVIDYQIGSKQKRLILEFNDSGMWASYQGYLTEPATRA